MPAFFPSLSSMKMNQSEAMLFLDCQLQLLLWPLGSVMFTVIIPQTAGFSQKY
jgi:hypothetical protein